MTYIHNQIPVIQKTYDFYKAFYQSAKTFPKSDKYGLGEKIKNLILDTLELLVAAETAKKDWKQPVLEKASHKLSLLKLLLRLCHEIKVLDLRRYTDLSERLLEIGRMIGGWIKAVR